MLRLRTVAGYSLLAVAILFFFDVIARYLLGITASWIIELEWYIAAVGICLSLAPTLHTAKHVQVDLLFAKAPRTTQKFIIGSGHLLFLLPWSIFIVYASSKYAYNSWLIGESSPDPGGLPYRWLIKLFIPIGFALLGIEGIIQLVTGSKYTSQSSN